MAILRRVIGGRSTVVLVVLFSLGYCLAAGAPGVSAQTAPTVQSHQTTAQGNVLAGPDGKTLYTLSSDPPGSSTCNDACTTPWPPLVLASGNPVAAAGITGTLGVITRADGKRQVTYNNQPLYGFARDTQPGDTNGEGVTAFGGTWHVVKVAAAAAGQPAAAGQAAPARTLPANGTAGLLGHSTDRTAEVTGLVAAALLLSLAGVVFARRSGATGSHRH